MIIFADIKRPPIFLITTVTTLFILISLLFFCNNALAAEPELTITDRLINTYKDLGTTWGANIKSHAIWLLNALLVIEVVFLAVRLGFQKADITDVIAELVRVAIFGATFFCLIIYGQELAGKIVDGFINLSKDIHGPPQIVSNFFIDSFSITRAMTKLITIMRPGVGIMIGLCIVVSIVCAALTYGMYLIILCEAWIVMNVGILILGFGGNRHTRSWAANFMRYALAVGLKLFIIQLLINVIYTLVHTIVDWEFNTATDVFVVTANFVICAFLVKALPDSLASFVSNYSGSSGGMMAGAMAAATGTAVGAASMGTGAVIGASGGGGLAGGLGGAQKGALMSLSEAAQAHLKKGDGENE
ncbi:P-type conjugative transfer protein TrbL [Desulforhopalus singaporensis]|uniref:P-type conjugative transfer protein TrbL n=1 Tax=Desulforhopalus singaporensis TaxID=91360 RepID=A0A1H0S2Z6_9BACT|nr:P-type conjugative transfer protein TrbL [Desulforhopalus singaporensis]SDP35985.1 P-type conjugative transfer protein TrbL [Desulforhopalus singaporensis]